MPETYTQKNSPLRFQGESLGEDDLLITRLAGSEALSELFEFDLDFIAPLDKPIVFKDVLGKLGAISLQMPDNSLRYFQGLIVRLAQGIRDDTFLTYKATLAPPVWLLTKRTQSRIFQHVSVPEILKAVFNGFKVAYQIQGTFNARDYCVQYRESDFAFASRLMEEEGLYYYFRHTDSACEMVISNTSQGHDKVPAPATLTYDEAEGGDNSEGRVTAWQKVQEVRSGQVTLWDHCFELPDKHLEAGQKIQDSVAVGQVNHALKLPVSDNLEQYDYPGGYADRFDGIDRGGGQQSSELQKIFDDNRRTARLRIQEEAAGALTIEGSSDCRQLTAGHTFTLDKHFDADGDYVLTRITHEIGLSGGGYRAGGESGLDYQNTFQCIPIQLPFRPSRVTPKPAIQGTQTAVVVGPQGEEIFTDKYGRIKVQFHWDRQGKFDANSSCWIRVAQFWAGKQWGSQFIPRIGDDVVISFLEGDPDRPLIVGSVYNADNMPLYQLPSNKTQSGILTHSSPRGSGQNYNALRFEDKKGAEQIWLHAEKNQDIEVESDETHWVGHDRTKTIDHDETTHVKHDRTETVDNNETITVHGNRTETVDKNESLTVSGSQTDTIVMTQSTTIGLTHTIMVGGAQAITVGLAQAITVGSAQAITVGSGQAVTVGGDQVINVGGNVGETIGGGFTQSVANDHATTVQGGRTATVGKDDSLSVEKSLSINAGEEITITTGDATLQMKKDGTIILKGKDILIDGSGKITVKAASDMTLKGSKIAAN
jgi:type VI secretion system secreted protein VgrG